MTKRYTWQDQVLPVGQATMLARRRFAIALGAGALAPLAALAQQKSKVWRVGFLAQRHLQFVDSDPAYGFTAMAHQKATALVVTLESFFQQQRNQIVELARSTACHP